MDANHNLHQHAELAKGLLEVARLFSKVCFPRDGERYATRADDLILYAALFVGQAEGRPMNHSKLAEYAGMSRPTVVRKVAALMEQGTVVKVGGGYALTPSAVNRAAAVKTADAATRLLAKLARASGDLAPFR